MYIVVFLLLIVGLTNLGFGSAEQTIEGLFEVLQNSCNDTVCASEALSLSSTTRMWLISPPSRSFSLDTARSLLEYRTFRPDLRTIVYCPDPTEMGSPGELDVVKGYVSREAYNVVVLDTRDVVPSIYISPATMRALGKRLGLVLSQMILSGLPLQLLELSGAGLGAQVACWAARAISQRSKRLLPRFLALDPKAGPCQYKVYSKFVLAVHSSKENAVGHLDLYPPPGRPCLILCRRPTATKIWRAVLEHPKDFYCVKCRSVELATQGRCERADRMRSMSSGARNPNPGVKLGPTINPKLRGIFLIQKAPCTG